MATGSGNLSGGAPAPPPGNLPAGAQSAESATAAIAARVRALMIISALTTAIAVAAVFGVIGYRIFHAGESGRAAAGGGAAGAPAMGIVTLPQGARVIATAVADGRLVVTIEIAGAIEIRTFDVDTLKETGRLRFATEP